MNTEQREILWVCESIQTSPGSELAYRELEIALKSEAAVPLYHYTLAVLLECIQLYVA